MNNYIYTCDSPFHDYRYWPKTPCNKDSREHSS